MKHRNSSIVDRGQGDFVPVTRAATSRPVQGLSIVGLLVALILCGVLQPFLAHCGSQDAVKQCKENFLTNHPQCQDPWYYDKSEVSWQKELLDKAVAELKQTEDKVKDLRSQLEAMAAPNCLGWLDPLIEALAQSAQDGSFPPNPNQPTRWWDGMEGTATYNAFADFSYCNSAAGLKSMDKLYALIWHLIQELKNAVSLERDKAQYEESLKFAVDEARERARERCRKGQTNCDFLAELVGSQDGPPATAKEADEARKKDGDPHWVHPLTPVKPTTFIVKPITFWPIKHSGSEEPGSQPDKGTEPLQVKPTTFIVKPITFLPIQPPATTSTQPPKVETPPDKKTDPLVVKPSAVIVKPITFLPITIPKGPDTDPDGNAFGSKTGGDKGKTPQPAQPTGGGKWTVQGGPDPDAGAPGTKTSGVKPTGPDPDAGAPGPKTGKSSSTGSDLTAKANLPGKGGQAPSPAKPIPTLQSAGGKPPQPRDMDRVRAMASQMRSDQPQRISTGPKGTEKPSAAGTAKPGTASSQAQMQAKTQPQHQVKPPVSQPRPSPAPSPRVQPRPQPKPHARPAVTPPRPAAVHRPPSVSRGPSHARRRMGPESGEEAKSCPPIVLAALDGDSHKVKEILNQPAEINSKDSEGTTALMAAVSAGNPELVKMLLDKAAADKAISKQKVINAKDNSGRTALMAACEEDRAEVAKLLVERGAGVNASDNQGVTALMIACQLQQPEVVKLLLNSRANVNTATKDGWTSLMFASAGEDIEVVRLLLEKGANVNSRAKNGSTPLKIASEGDNRQIVKMLQDKGADLEGRTKQDSEETIYEYPGIWIIPYWAN